jgi:hypothetical protein
MSFYEWMDAHPDRAAVYDEAMESTTDSFLAAIDAYDFPSTGTVVDVGGGQGGLLTCLLRRRPALGCVLFERPATAQLAERTLAAAGLSDRIRCVGGDLFSGLPPGADIYVYSTVLRCFDDATCVAALRTCASAMAPHSRVLGLEMVIPERPGPTSGLGDLQALSVYGGADRDASTWAALFDAAGLRLVGITPADAPYAWVEGRLPG